MSVAALIIAISVIAIFLSPHRVASINTYSECVEAGYPVIESDSPICRVGSRSFIGPLKPKSAAQPALSSVSFDILVNGDTGNSLPTHMQTLIDTQQQWNEYWHSVHAGLVTLPPIIPVNFDTSSVVAFSLGPKNTSGYGITVTNIAVSTIGSTVDVTEATPTIGCSVTNTLTNRYLIIRSIKLISPVTFRTTAQKRQCK
jgi:hypothetical protein